MSILVRDLRSDLSQSANPAQVSWKMFQKPGESLRSFHIRGKQSATSYTNTVHSTCINRLY